MMWFFISRNIDKFVKNVKEYKTKLLYYQSFCHQVYKLIMIMIGCMVLLSS